MISKTGFQKMELFFNSLSGMNKAELKKACKLEIEELKTSLSITTVRSYLTTYRKESIKNGLEISKFLTIKKSENTAIEKAYNKKIAKQSKEQKSISNFSGAIDKAVDVIMTSENLSELVASLCFLTGRRMIEILKTAKFTNVKNRQNKLQFAGQAKKRGNAEKYEIFTLNNSSDAVKFALKRVRELSSIEDLTNDQISRKYETGVNMKALQLFSQFLGRCTCKDLRNAYAAIAIHLYKPKDQTPNSFLVDVLGHDESDLTTANTYQKYYIEK